MTPLDASGRRVAARVLDGTSGIEHFLIVSSIDLELLKVKGKANIKKRQELLQQIPGIQSFCEAFDHGGPDAAHELATASETIPRSVWWLTQRSAFESELQAIYERLRRSSRPYDAFVDGTHGTLAWILLWLD